MDWLPIPNAPQYVAAVPSIYRAGLAVLETEWADRVPPAAIDVARAVDPQFEELLHRTAGGPSTLIHSDTRLDNVCFERSGNGIAMIDFQLALQGRAVADIAYLVGTSVPHELGRDQWEVILRHWHSAIVDLGVSDYSFGDALRHYREAAMYYLSGAMSLIGTFDAGNDRGVLDENSQPRRRHRRSRRTLSARWSRRTECHGEARCPTGTSTSMDA